MRAAAAATAKMAKAKMAKRTTTDNLAEYLDALQANERLESVKVLKSSPVETTELVSDDDGRLFVRKTISRESGTGGAYAQLKAAQDAGRTSLHLPRVHIFAKTESDIIVVMEYLQGENLWDRLEREGCGPAAARKYFPALCRAVSELHVNFDPPIIHRDLKPTNVLITRQGFLKLIDFGISRAYRADATADTQFLGTREYAPPEQFGYRQTDERSDVYSLGMILYHLLTGQTPSAALHDGGFEDPDIPEALRPVLMRATEFDPDRRYQSADDLRLAFEASLGGGTPAGAKAGAKAKANANAKAAAATPAVPAVPATPAVPAPEPSPEEALENSTFIAVARDIIALAIIAFGLFMFFGTWEDPGTEVDWAYRTGMLLSGFVIFLPMLPIAYWVSSKRLMKRWFPSLARLTRKQEILYGILFAVAAFIAVFVLLLIITSGQAG